MSSAASSRRKVKRKPTRAKQLGISDAARQCSRCGALLPAAAFYFVSRKLGTRRGQCKDCMREVKALQRDPAWMPACVRCGAERPRIGPGRRLCVACFTEAYEEDYRRENGSHRLRLNPCPLCGVVRLRADHVKGTMLCAVCRGVPQSRRKRLKEYNLTPREYVELLAAQGERCAICRRLAKGTLHIDHRHASPSIVRGAICNVCNTLIGLALERKERLQAAIDYLAEPPAQVLFPGREAREEANRNGMSWNRLTRVAS